MKKPILIICLLLVAVNGIHARQNSFPKLTGPYLNWSEAEDLGRFLSGQTRP